jgi:mannose-6-phosphate isomerase
VRAEQLLNWVAVHAGEMIYVDAGTVHTIGPGVILLETQQNSDTTYRLYDYGRRREMHVKEGLAALKERTRAGKVASQAAVNGRWTGLVDSPCFTVSKVALRGSQPLIQHAEVKSSRSCAEVLVALDGCGVVECNDAPAVTLTRGETVIVPASVRDYSIRGQWKVEVLRAKVPGGKVSAPETTL